MNSALDWTLDHDDSELRLGILNIRAQCTMACKHLPRNNSTAKLVKHVHRTHSIEIRVSFKFVLRAKKPVHCAYPSVWGSAVHYCEQICGFCVYVDLQPSPQQGRRQKEEDFFPSARTGPLSPLSDVSAKSGSPSCVCEWEKKSRKT